jgi:5'(3')-deoxyribonucleotidase
MNAMTKQIIAIDCDDVILETAQLILNWYNHTYGTRLQPSDYYSDSPAAWGVADDAIAIKRVDRYLATEEYFKAPPLPGAVTITQRLSAHYELHVVTGRADFLRPATTTTLERYFPGVFASIEFTNFFNQRIRSKSEVCRQLGVDILIDDHLHHALDVAKIGTKVLLFGNYPWNQTRYLPANIQRANTWHDVEKILLSPR